MATAEDKAHTRALVAADQLAQAMDELIGDAPGWIVTIQNYKGEHPMVERYRLDEMSGISVKVKDEI